MIEEPEQRDHADDLAVIKVTAELNEILAGRLVGDQRGVVREPQRSPLGIAEQLAGVIAPDLRELLELAARAL